MSEIVFAALLVCAVNAMPAFMPPTWALLAFIHLNSGIDVPTLSVVGALAASFGRLALALASRHWGRRLLPPARRISLERLGEWLDAKARWSAPLAVLVYSFGPIPTNQLFIAVGLTRMSMRRMFAVFFVGRLISYPLWIGAAHVAAARLDDLFGGRVTHVTAVIVDIALIVLVIAFTRVDWVALIGRLDPSFAPFGPSGRLPSGRASAP